jgi:hypothetical protein
MCKTKLKITSDEFYNMTPKELDYMLSEKTKYDRLGLLDQALYVSYLVQKEKANDIYIDIRNQILGVDTTVDKNKFKRFKMISKRLEIEYPGERVE